MVSSENTMLKALAHSLFRRILGKRADFREATALLRGEPLQSDAVRRRLPAFLASGSWDVRNVAVKLVERLQDDRFYPVLLAKVRDGSDCGIVVRNAISAVRRLGLNGEDVEGALRAALAAPYWETRCEAVRALTELFPPTPERSQTLTNVLRPRPNGDGSVHFFENNFEVRAAVAMALGSFGTPESALPVLRELAADSHWLVRNQAAVATAELCRRCPEALAQGAGLLDSIDVLSEGCRSDFPFPQTVASLRKAVHNDLAHLDPAAIRKHYIDMATGWNRKR